MKKMISFVLCLCMALSMSAFAVSAEVAAAEIKDGAIIEFENYGGADNKDLYAFTSDEEGYPTKPYGDAVISDHVTETGASLSGNGVLCLAERTGATGLTFTIPVSVTEPGLYEVEWYGTDGGQKGEYLSRYTVSAGDASFEVAGNTVTYFHPAKETVVGGGTDFSYYPIKLLKTQMYLTEDTENLVITATPNTIGTASGLGIKMAIDCMKFNKVVVPTASWDKETVIEMEDYLSNIRYTFTEGHTNAASYLAEAKASGGALMNMEEKGYIRSMEFDIRVNIETDGWYNINLIASTSNKSDTSVLYIKDGDDEWVNNWKNSGYAGSQLLYFGTAEAHRYYGIYDHKTTKYLKAGEYTLVASAVGITNNPNATKFLADCLIVAPSKTEIPAAGKRLEIEDYRALFSRQPGRQTNNETGETFLSDLGGHTTELITTLEFEKSGYYDVSFHGTPWNNNGLSKINFYLGDKIFMDNDNSKYGVNEGYLFSQYLPAWMFTKERVYVEAGSHIFKMEIIERIPERPDVLCAHASDYLEFVRTPIPEISADETSVIEMEDQIPFIEYTFGPDGTNSANRVEAEKASGGAVMNMAEKSNIAAMKVDIPFIVKESGWYKVNLLASNGDVNDTSVLYIKNGEEEWLNSWQHSGYAGMENVFFGTDADGMFKWYPVKEHEVIRYIEAGEYTLTASASSIKNQANATKFVADCLKFTPMKIVLPENGVLELETMKTMFTPWVPGSGVAEGDASVSMLHTYDGKDVQMVLPIDFPKSGYYDMTFRGTPWNNNGLSKINISVDDTLIMNNDESKGGVNLGYNYKQYLPAYEFTKEFVYIEAGVHNVMIEAFMRNPDPAKKNECAFGMDSLAFALVTDEAVVDTNAKSVHVTTLYDAPVSGEIVVASYVGDEMVGFDSFTETDISFLDVAVSYSGSVAPDTVKVFVWKDLTDVVPVMTGKVFEIK